MKRINYLLVCLACSLAFFISACGTMTEEIKNDWKSPLDVSNSWKGRCSQSSQNDLQQSQMVILLFYAATSKIGCSWDASSCDDARHREDRYFLG